MMTVSQRGTFVPLGLGQKVPLPSLTVAREGKEMTEKGKKYANKYWENEEGELIEFGDCFMRCYDGAGKLQFGRFVINAKTGEKRYHVKFVLDRKELVESSEGLSYLMQTLEDWEAGSYED